MSPARWSSSPGFFHAVIQPLSSTLASERRIHASRGTSTCTVSATRSKIEGTAGGGVAAGASGAGGGAPGPITTIVGSSGRTEVASVSGICSTSPSVSSDPSSTGAAVVPEIHSHPLTAPRPY
jgi:hypothetical protein